MRRLALPLLLLLGACATPMGTASMTSPATAMTDADILRVFMASNTAEVLTSQPVRDSDNAAVRDFARMMIQMHTETNARAEALPLEPRDNQVSMSMERMVAGQVAELNDASGTARDMMYVEKQVVLHGHTLDMLTHVLIPSARDPQLRALLESSRPTVAAHLEQAKRLHHQMMR